MVKPTEDYYSDHDRGKFAPIEAITVATWKARALLENLTVDLLADSLRVIGENWHINCQRGDA